MSDGSMEQTFITTITNAYNQGGFEAFFKWFSVDETDTLEAAIRWGFADFATAVLREPVPGLIGQMHEKVALEIGYGGGRLIRPASYMFQEVKGVDIHPLTDVVADYLQKQTVHNVQLFVGDGKTLPIPDQSIDFVYSFIVFIHLSDSDVFESYISEVGRVLKPAGVASIYYGIPYAARYLPRRIGRQSSVVSWLWYYLVEGIVETVRLDILGDGYRRWSNTKANTMTLGVSKRKTRSVAQKSNLKVISIKPIIGGSKLIW